MAGGLLDFSQCTDSGDPSQSYSHSQQLSCKLGGMGLSTPAPLSLQLSDSEEQHPLREATNMMDMVLPQLQLCSQQYSSQQFASQQLW